MIILVVYAVFIIVTTGWVVRWPLKVLMILTKVSRSLMTVVYEFTAGWVNTVKIASSNKVKIVPRVMFEGWSMSDYSTLFASRDMALDVAKTIKHTLLVITVIC